MASKKYSFSKEDLTKVGKGFLIAISGAAIAAGASYLEALPEMLDVGAWQAVFVALVSTAVNAARKFLTDYQKNEIMNRYINQN